jgi:hypothetical protein
MMVGIIVSSIAILGLIYKSIKQFQRYFYFRKNGILTEGEVENVTIETDSDGDKRYLIIVKFKTIEGKSFKNVVKKADDYYHEGLKVHVLYDQENPIDFLVNDPKADKEMEGAIFALLFVIIFSIIVYFMVEHPESNND